MQTLAIRSLTCAAALLVACEHTPPKLVMSPAYEGRQAASADGAPSSGVVCTREVPTGLLTAVTRCRDTAEIDKRRAMDREWAEKIPAELPKER